MVLCTAGHHQNMRASHNAQATAPSILLCLSLYKEATASCTGRASEVSGKRLVSLPLEQPRRSSESQLSWTPARLWATTCDVSRISMLAN